jgi:hypothetical protein
VTGKPDAGGDTIPSNATANATNGPNTTADATPNPADRAEGGNSGNSGIRSGDFSGPASCGTKVSEDATLAEVEARRATISGEGERRVRRLVREGMAEGWALREVLASDHPLDCECGVCL